MTSVLEKFQPQEGINPAHALEIHSYRYGDEIVREGEPSLYFYVILSGQVRISQKNKKIRVLNDHDIFGLENVVFSRPSSYSAKALTKSRVAMYGPEALDHFIHETPRMIQSIMVSTLHQLMQTTQNLTQESETFALDDVRVNFYSDNETVIEEGYVGTDFYRLVSSQGGLKVSIQGRHIATIAKPGEFFGEMAGLLGLPRQATVTSIGDSVVEVYNMDDLDIIIRDYPDVALQMMRTLVSRLIEVNRKLTGTPL